MDLRLQHDRTQKAGRLSLHPLLSGERAVDADADDAVGLHALVGKRADPADDAVIVRAKNEPLLEVVVRREDRVGGVAGGGYVDRSAPGGSEEVFLLEAGLDQNVARALGTERGGLESGGHEHEGGNFFRLPAALLGFVSDGLTDLTADLERRDTQVGDVRQRLSVGADQAVVHAHQLHVLGLADLLDRAAELNFGRADNDALDAGGAHRVENRGYIRAVLGFLDVQFDAELFGSFLGELRFVLEPAVAERLDDEADLDLFTGGSLGVLWCSGVGLGGVTGTTATNDATHEGGQG